MESPPPVQASGRDDGTSVSAGRPSKPPTPATGSPTIPEPTAESPPPVQASGRDDGTSVSAGRPSKPPTPATISPTIPEPPAESPPPVQAGGRYDGTSVLESQRSKPTTPATESPTIPEPGQGLRQSTVNHINTVDKALDRDYGQHGEPEEAVAQGEPYSQVPGPEAVARLDSSDRSTVPESPAAEPDEWDAVAESGEPAPKGSATPEGERRTSTAAPVSKQESPEYTDLVMISGLAQWTDRVLRKGGREYLESLLDVTEMTGRTSSRLKEIVLAFVDLLDKKDSTTRISAKEMVSLLAQLDAIMGIHSSTDARLHALLLQEDLEVFPLIQP